MNISIVDITVNNDDLKKFITKFPPETENITNLNAAFKESRLSVTGRLSFLNVEAIFEISHTATEVVVRLDRLHPMGGIAQLFKSKIMEKIIESRPYARLDKDDKMELFNLIKMLLN